MYIQTLRSRTTLQRQTTGTIGTKPRRLASVPHVAPRLSPNSPRARPPRALRVRPPLTRRSASVPHVAPRPSLSFLVDQARELARGAPRAVTGECSALPTAAPRPPLYAACGAAKAWKAKNSSGTRVGGRSSGSSAPWRRAMARWKRAGPLSAAFGTPINGTRCSRARHLAGGEESNSALSRNKPFKLPGEEEY